MSVRSAHPFKHHCFISYTHREPDSQQIQAPLANFARRLRDKGYSVQEWMWIDFDRLGVGVFDDAELKRALETGIDDSIAVISFVSPKYVASRWCQFEWGHRVRQGHPLVAPRRSLVWKELGNVRDYDDLARPVAAGAVATALPFQPITEDFIATPYENPLLDWKNWERAFQEAVRFLDKAYDERMVRWEALRGSGG